MNKTLMNITLLKNLYEIDLNDIIKNKNTIIGLDIGDKTIGVSVSDRRIKIASSVLLISRTKINNDCAKLYENIVMYNPKIIIFGWPLQMNGVPSKQCEKNFEFIKAFHSYITTTSTLPQKNWEFAKWDERFSTKVVDNIMIEADLSRKRRKEIIDKTAAVYILQGALDFLNRNQIKQET